MDIRELLQFMVQQNISDIHFKANAAPLIRLNGRLISTQYEPFSPDAIKTLAYSIMTDHHKASFEQEGELDMAYAVEGISRFRINVYRQKGTIALTLRVIPLEMKPFETLNLPTPMLKKMCSWPSGLILVAGITGAGKTTTMNSMVNYINEQFAYNIITVEDPIEFYHKDKKSSISQREVGNDTHSFSAALKYILRQDPDVIVIGEMRDAETIQTAISAAETGHLVLSTIHTRDALHTIQRMVDSYPASMQSQVRTSIAGVLRGVIAQQLVPTVDEKSLLPCTEIMMMTPYIRQLVVEGKMSDVYSSISRSSSEGMMTFDQDLLRLCKEGKISNPVALETSSRPDNLFSMLQGISVKA